MDWTRYIRLIAGVLSLIVFAAAPNAFAYTEKTLHAFCQEGNCADGSHPHDLAMDRFGNLYGVTDSGGKHLGGSVFEYAPSTGIYNVLYSFCRKANCADGRFPYRVKLVIDAAGNLYGTAGEYGPNGSSGGVVFELMPGNNGWQYKILYAFCAEMNCADGGGPGTGVTYAGAGSGTPYDGISPLYGTTEFQGPYGRGVVFELKPGKSGAWKERVLYGFCPDMDQCPDGLDPEVPLYADGAENLFGATQSGGAHGGGVAYELSPKGKQFEYRVIHNFCVEERCADGGDPFASLVMDGAGNLLGATWSGGEFGEGLLYKLTPRAKHWRYSILTTFDDYAGQLPSSVMLDATGALFGTTLSDSIGFGGTIFKYDGALQALYRFCAEKHCADGRGPNSLVQDSAGNLFGTTGSEGHRDSGTLFELSP
jgi:uncharacterized repeat protein (TIGR03803 family)